MCNKDLLKDYIRYFIDSYLTNKDFDRLCYLTDIVDVGCNNCTLSGYCSETRLDIIK